MYKKTHAGSFCIFISFLTISGSLWTPLLDRHNSNDNNTVYIKVVLGFKLTSRLLRINTRTCCVSQDTLLQTNIYDFDVVLFEVYWVLYVPIIILIFKRLTKLLQKSNGTVFCSTMYIVGHKTCHFILDYLWRFCYSFCTSGYANEDSMVYLQKYLMVRWRHTARHKVVIDWLIE